MLDDISFALPLTGVVKYTGAVTAGLLLGMVLSRSDMASAKSVTDALKFQNSRILKTLLTALLTAILLLPFLAKLSGLPIPEGLRSLPLLDRISFLPSPVSGAFWQSVLAGAVTGIGLFLSGRTLLSSLAAVGKGEIHALWFLAGAGAAVWLFDEWDIEPDKWIKKFDFSTGSLPVRSGWNFFDPQMFCFWVTLFIAGVLLMVYFSSLSGKKEK